MNGRKVGRPRRGDGYTKTTMLEPCRCKCGAALEVTCPNGCADAEVYARADMDPIARLKVPTKPDTPPRTTRARRGPKVVQPLAICTRCGKEIPRRKGRPAKYHDACRTPLEQSAIESKRAYNESRRSAVER